VSFVSFQFEKEEEAFETRVALHGIKWPISNPKSLFVDYATQDQLDQAMAKESGDGKDKVNGNVSLHHNTFSHFVVDSPFRFVCHNLLSTCGFFTCK